MGFSLPERCTVATVVMMPDTTGQTQWGSLNKHPAHSSASAAQQHGTKSTSWRAHQSGIKIIYCDYFDSLTLLYHHFYDLITKARLRSAQTNLDKNIQCLHLKLQASKYIWTWQLWYDYGEGNKTCPVWLKGRIIVWANKRWQYWVRAQKHLIKVREWLWFCILK